MLSTIHYGTQLSELMAASCEEGIGIIATWELQSDGSWKVEAMDTEGQEMREVTDFHEGEPVPPTPPTVFDDLPAATEEKVKSLRYRIRQLRCYIRYLLPMAEDIIGAYPPETWKEHKENFKTIRRALRQKL